jgi:hypothetical protein
MFKLTSIAALLIVGPLAAQTTSGQQPILPILDCLKVERQAHQRAIAYWGYINPNSAPITLPVPSAQNFFLPSPADVGQPSVFPPGEHHFVFETIFPASSHQTWQLDGVTGVIVADPVNADCPSYLVFKGDWVSGAGYVDGDVVRHNNMYFEAKPVGTFDPSALPTITTTTPPPSPGWSVVTPSTTPIMNLPGSGAPGFTSGPFITSSVNTFPNNGKITINDPNILPTSIVLVQYVGGQLLPPAALNVVAGAFTAVGLPGQKFRYAVMN